MNREKIAKVLTGEAAKVNKKMYKRVLELEEAGEMVGDIGYRGGNYGLPASRFISEFVPEKLFHSVDIEDWLPGKVGVYCNYLGGGLRGAVCGGGYDEKMPVKAAKIIDDFTEVCKKRYFEIENGLNNEVDESGETNWDAVGTNASRRAGVISAY